MQEYTIHTKVEEIKQFFIHTDSGNTTPPESTEK